MIFSKRPGWGPSVDRGAWRVGSVERRSATLHASRFTLYASGSPGAWGSSWQGQAIEADRVIGGLNVLKLSETIGADRVGRDVDPMRGTAQRGRCLDPNGLVGNPCNRKKAVAVIEELN